MSATASLSFDIYLRATPRQVRAVLGHPAFAPRWLADIEFQPGREEDPRRLTCEWLQSDHLEANGGSHVGDTCGSAMVPTLQVGDCLESAGAGGIRLR